jgi:hypothetical protein
MPNDSSIQGTHTSDLPFPTILEEVQAGHIFSQIRDSPLSIGVLCDHDCTAIFDKTKVTVRHHNQTVLIGHRDPITKLWTIPVSDQPSIHHVANNVYEQRTQPNLVQYTHAACGYPTTSTWIQAIDKGHFVTWPGLTASLVRKHLPKSIPTSKGHLDQQRKGIRTTKPQPDKPISSAPTTNGTDTTPQSENPNLRTHYIYARSYDVTGEIATDLPEPFPITSAQGHKDILVLYEYDGNVILVEPMRNRMASEHLRAYNKLHQQLCDRGFRPQLQKLDNEASTLITQIMRTKGIDFQLIPPNMHRRNAAKRAIRTLKNNFVAILSGTDKLFPLNRWHLLLPQSELILDLLRSSRLNPNSRLGNISTAPFLILIGRQWHCKAPE